MNLIERVWHNVRDWPPTAATPIALEANRRRGAVAVIVGLMSVVLIGFSALGIEVTAVLVKYQRMQSAADAAAVAGAVALAASSPSGATAEAEAEAAADGFIAGKQGVTVTVNNPPLSGPNAGSNAAVEVIIVQPQTLVLASIIYRGAWKVTTRAVALVGSNASSCVLQTDTSSTAGVQVSQGAAVTLNGCGLAANADGGMALSVGSGGSLTASAVTAIGSGGGAGVTTTPAADNIAFSQRATADPYAVVAVPAVSGCEHGSAGNPLNLGWTQSPQIIQADGAYCGGLSLDNGANVVMSPGVYIMSGGSFSVAGGATLVGTGVTIVLTGPGPDYTTVSISNGATVTLSAPTTGPTAGMVFLQNRNASNTGSNTTNIFAGGSSLNFTGALYFPSQPVYYSNGTTTSSSCTQLVAWRMVFTGSAAFNSNCANTGVTSIGASPTRLVE